MERDSILFYRSFYEAIQGLSKDIQLEIYTAVMEYGLNGVVPDNLKPVAKGMFALMKPVLDSNNVRFENGKKGGRKPRTSTKKPTPNPEYSLTFEQEVEQMKADAEWTASVCEDYHLTPEEYSDRLKRFLKHCKDNRKKKPHDSFDDAKSHLRYWMDKAYPRNAQPSTPADNSSTTDLPDIGSDFGAADYDEQPSTTEFTPPFNTPDTDGY